MATVGELVRDVLGSLSMDTGAPIAAKWVDNRYKEVVNRCKFRPLRELGELRLPGRYSTGTLSVTLGSTSVTGSSTEWETYIGNSNVEYWQIKPSTAWHNISAIDSETALTLATAFTETTVSAGAYSAVKRWHPLVSNARWLGDFCLTRLRLPIGRISLEEMDRRYPGRILTGIYPRAVCEMGTDSSGYRLVELYPPGEDPELIHYVYLPFPSALTFTSTIPAQIDPYMLKEGVLVDAYRWLAARAATNMNVELAAYWRNESRAQMTTWERVITDIAKANRGIDDISFILKMYGGGVAPDDYDAEVTARDYVYNRWSPPY